MKRTALALFLLVASLQAARADCGFVGGLLGVCEAIDVANLRIAELQKALVETADKAIRAVPGERYLQLIDDLNGTDAEKREKAKAFLENLAGVKPGVTYQMVVSATYAGGDGSVPFRLDALRSSAPSEINARAYVEQGSVVMVDMRSAPVSVRPMEQVQADVRAAVERTIAGITGSPIIQGPAQGPTFPIGTLKQVSAGYQNDSLISGVIKPVPMGMPFQPTLDEAIAERDQRRNAVVANLTEAIMQTVRGHVLLTSETSRGWSWDPIDPRPFALIFIDEATYQAHEDFSISVSVNEVANPQATLYNRAPHTLTKRDFDPRVRQPIVHPTRGSYYWTFVEMTGQLNLSEAHIAQIESLRKTLAELSKGTPPED